MASIRDVAARAGVSPATVSRAFTTPGLISVPTQQRVFEAAQHLNYQPARTRVPRQNATSRDAAPAPSASPVIGVRDAIGFQFFSATSTPGDTLAHNTFYAPLLSGAQSEAALLGLHLLVHTTDRHTLSQEMPRMIEERVLGGMLLVGTADPEILSAFSAYVDNIVLVDNHDPSGVFESVVSDGFGGAYTATRYLIDLGHRRLGFLMGESNTPSFQARLRGFLCAQIEAGILPTSENVAGGMEGNDDAEARLKHLALILRSGSDRRPTALLTVNDENALRASRLCRELGLSIPGDISLVGFDDTPFSCHAEPPLTTVRVDKEYMGRLAVRRLHARMMRQAGKYERYATPRVEPPVSSRVGVALQIRQSCAPPSVSG